MDIFEANCNGNKQEYIYGTCDYQLVYKIKVVQIFRVSKLLYTNVHYIRTTIAILVYSLIKTQLYISFSAILKFMYSNDSQLM